LSRAYPGGREAFVAAMNRKARELGMNDSASSMAPASTAATAPLPPTW